MEEFNAKKARQGDHEDLAGIPFYSRSVSLLDSDPLEEIFALNVGDFLTEHLINPELAKKIGMKVKNKNESLKDQLQELIGIYSINNTLMLLGFESDEEQVIYDSIAKTMALMLSLDECNIYLAKRDEDIKMCGTSKVETSAHKGVPDYVINCWKEKQSVLISGEGVEVQAFPMKNNFECIGAFEVIRSAKKPLEKEFCELMEITAGLYVTSLGLQKLIDEVKRVMKSKVVSTSELQNLRAQLTAIIGDLGDQQQSFVEILAVAVDKKGSYERNHSKHTAELSRKLCEHLGLNEKTTDLIYYAGLLQNIGHITLSEDIFSKKGKLTEEEWKKLQDSPNAGVSLLMNINFLSEVVPYVHYQKERWDGNGVPEGLKSQSIPFGSRIIALADAYCALCEERPHRPALSSEEAMGILQKEAGVKWDPIVVQALAELEK